MDEELIHNATEKAGMLLIQVERFLRVLACVTYLVCFGVLAFCVCVILLNFNLESISYEDILGGAVFHNIYHLKFSLVYFHYSAIYFKRSHWRSFSFVFLYINN